MNRISKGNFSGRKDKFGDFAKLSQDPILHSHPLVNNNTEGRTVDKSFTRMTWNETLMETWPRYKKWRDSNHISIERFY